MKQIDARGRACPEPVVMTMKGVKESPDGVIVMVDNVCAVENVTRFAASRKFKIKQEQIGADFTLTLSK